MSPVLLIHYRPMFNDNLSQAKATHTLLGDPVNAIVNREVKREALVFLFANNNDS